ncbi:tumor necrosis factor ligand superfamily member 10-like isoform X2 [Branchiostoma lanceolatum]|uniref:tumor necrosis factor ligand superfamily member 10-like isoform X2 n=1 Tax=Branchiostoma lanceolatum TaxID=7740 RepID=UPI003453D9AB
MALEASPNRGEGELVVIPRRSFYAVIFAVTLLVLTTLALGVGGFVYLLRQVEQLRETRCACAPMKRDVPPNLTGEVEPHADWHVAAAAEQLSAILRNGRDKRNLPWLDVDEELPDVVLESLGLEAEEAREESDSVPEGDPPLSRTKRGGGGKKGGRGKKGSGLKAAHIQGAGDGKEAHAVPVGAENVDRFGPARRFKFKDGQINHWKYASWMGKAEYLEHRDAFYLDPLDGSLMVTEAGLYFVYSQVYYYDGSHAFLSHIIKDSGERESFLQCIQSPANESRKYNTCFTAGVFHLDEGDKIVVQLQQKNGVVDVSPETSFFGMIKIAEPPTKKRVRRPKNKNKERGSSG